MKCVKITFICLMGILLHQRSFAPNVSEPIYLYVNHYHNKEVEERKIKIVKAIWEVEHPHNIQQAIAAYKREKAVGGLQIHQEVIDDVNNLILKKKVYTLNDCKDSLKSIEIFMLYHGYWNPSFNTYRVAMTHNGGPTWYKATSKQWVKLDDYWGKVLNNLNKING